MKNNYDVIVVGMGPGAIFMAYDGFCFWSANGKKFVQINLKNSH